MELTNRLSLSKFLTLILSSLGQLTLLLAVSLYFFDLDKLLDIYQSYPNFFDTWSDATILTKLIVASSLTPDISKVFIFLSYFSIALIYFAICLESLNSDIKLEKNYALTVSGYSSFLQDRIYFNHKLYSLSFLNIGLKENFELKVVPIINLWDGLLLFLRHVGVRYYSVYFFVGFILAPWCAFNAASSTEISIVPFWVAVLVYIHIQLKCITELFFFIRVFLTK